MLFRSTMSATETQSPPSQNAESAPGITVLSRMASIPMIHSSLDILNDTLSNNLLTRTPYSAATGLATTAYKLSEPLQIRLAPLIVSVDGIANKAVDAVESRYPYPFKVTPEDVVGFVTERKQTAVDGVHKTLDEKIKNPAFNAAHGIDQRFAPIVDYIEKTLSQYTHSEPGPSSPDPKYQYQRALALSRNLKDSLYEYSAEQLKHIHDQSVIVQSATESANSINALASSSYTNAQDRAHALSENMLAELQKLQTQTSSFAASIQSSINNSKSQLQNQLAPQVHQTYSEISSALATTVSDLTEILKKSDAPLQDRVVLVGKEVRERVSPLLETVKKGFADILARGKDIMSTPSSPKEEPSEKEPESNDANEPAPSLAEAVAVGEAPSFAEVTAEKA